MSKEILPHPKLTEKQKNFADELIETNSQTEAAMRTYDCKNRNVAKEIGYRNSNNPNIQAYIEAQLELNDTVGSSVRVLNDALEANIVHQGEQTNIPDHNTRLKASKQTHQLVAHKLQEAVPQNVHLEKHEHTHFSFGMDIPKVVLEWIAGKGKGRWPTEPEFKRLVDGKSV
jgi:phage terminase small subunit